MADPLANGTLGVALDQLSDTEVAQAVPPSSVCFALGPDQGLKLAVRLKIRTQEVRKAQPRLRPGLPGGAVLLVDHAVAARLLPWALRRASEGYRIVIASRAKTAAGARRSVVGLAEPSVWRWLGSFPSLALANDRLCRLPAAYVE